MAIQQIKTTLPDALARHGERVVDSEKRFESPEEYIRSLIREDMDSERYRIHEAMSEGFADIQEGRFFESSGEWKTDKQLLAKHESNKWR